MQKRDLRAQDVGAVRSACRAMPVQAQTAPAAESAALTTSDCGPTNCGGCPQTNQLTPSWLVSE